MLFRQLHYPPEHEDVNWLVSHSGLMIYVWDIKLLHPVLGLPHRKCPHIPVKSLWLQQLFHYSLYTEQLQDLSLYDIITTSSLYLAKGQTTLYNNIEMYILVLFRGWILPLRSFIMAHLEMSYLGKEIQHVAVSSMWHVNPGPVKNLPHTDSRVA